MGAAEVSPPPWGAARARLGPRVVPEPHGPVGGRGEEDARVAPVPRDRVDCAVVPRVAGHVLRVERRAALVQEALLGAHHEQVVLLLRAGALPPRRAAASASCMRRS